MLEIRPTCEQCDCDLPNGSLDAMICSFECTYCKVCALGLFQNICPSCGGNFVPRPIRPKEMIEKYPSSTIKVFKPKSEERIQRMIDKYKGLNPELR